VPSVTRLARSGVLVSRRAVGWFGDIAQVRDHQLDVLDSWRRESSSAML
jgi:hypothetical protein